MRKRLLIFNVVFLSFIIIILKSNYVFANNQYTPQSESSVSNYSQFAQAINDTSVTVINVTSDIDGTGFAVKLNDINRDITINGNSHSINIGKQVINLSNSDGLNHIFNLNKASISNGKYSEGFAVVSDKAKGKWTLNFSDITAKIDSINRVAQAHKCEVTFAGTNDISTAYENLELGSFSLKAGGNYLGNVYGTDWAAIDYTIGSGTSDTGSKRQLYIGEGAKINLKTTYNSSGQSSWPTIWGFYKLVSLEKNAQFYSKWGHDVFRANVDTASIYGSYPAGLTVNLKAGSIMDIDNIDDHDLPAFNADIGTNSINLEPGATFKAVSDGIYGAVAFDGGINTFYANQPKLVDLKNKRTNYKALTTILGLSTDFTIENSNISYWSSDVDNDSSPTNSFSNVKKISSKMVNLWSSDPSEVATELNKEKVQRISTKYVDQGSLSISEVPTKIGFGDNLKVPTKLTNFPAKNIVGNLKVSDTRTNKQNWELGVSINQDPTGQNTGYVLKDMLKYKSSLGDFLLNNSSTIVERNKNTNTDYIVSSNWNDNAGLYLSIPAGAVKADKYASKISWEIRDVPN